MVHYKGLFVGGSIVVAEGISAGLLLGFGGSIP